MSRTILITGGSGYVGRGLLALLAQRGERVLPWPTRAAGGDVRDRTGVRRLVLGLRPDLVVNLAAVQAGAPGEDLAATNVDGAANVARAAYEAGARFLHLSSDMVHDGSSAPYADEAPARPSTPYGHSKAQSESAVLDAHPQALVVRTSVVVDPVEPDRATQGFLERAEAGAHVTLFSDEVRSAILRKALVEALVDLAQTDACGRLNVAGPMPLTRLALGRAALRHASGDSVLERVRALTRAEAGLPERPADLTLDSSRAEALLGRRLPSVLAAFT